MVYFPITNYFQFNLNLNYFIDDKYAAEVKEYDAKTSTILEKVNTPPLSPTEYSDKTDKSK